jgi:hypothetical protein
VERGVGHVRLGGGSVLVDLVVLEPRQVQAHLAGTVGSRRHGALPHAGVSRVQPTGAQLLKSLLQYSIVRLRWLSLVPITSRYTPSGPSTLWSGHGPIHDDVVVVGLHLLPEVRVV